MATVQCVPLPGRGVVLPILAALTLIAVAAGEPVQSAAPLNATFGVAIDGYDPVAYFTQGRALRGSPEFAHDWLGATWYFASAEHRDRFAVEPTSYAPQFGGHCSRGMFKGKMVKADPEAWHIVAGTLYLFYSKETRAAWEKDPPEKLQTAKRNWQRLNAPLYE